VGRPSGHGSAALELSSSARWPGTSCRAFSARRATTVRRPSTVPWSSAVPSIRPRHGDPT
jgi:hypothetical protein